MEEAESLLKNKQTKKVARVSYLVVWNLLLIFIIVGILGFPLLVELVLVICSPS